MGKGQPRKKGKVVLEAEFKRMWEDMSLSQAEIALQHGITPAALGKSLAVVPVFTGVEGATGPASPLGAIVAALREGVA